MILEKVISGGQTGADQAGLRAAKKAGIETGGWMPIGFLTLAGSRPDLEATFGVKEYLTRGGYAARTWANVRDSDGTLRFASDFRSPGEICALKALEYHRKPYFDVRVPTKPNGYVDACSEAVAALGAKIQEAVVWIEEHPIRVLNVAGNSDRTCPNIGLFVGIFLGRLFDLIKKQPKMEFLA